MLIIKLIQYKNTHSIGSADAETLIPETEDITRQGTCAREASVPAQLGFRASASGPEPLPLEGKGKASDIVFKTITVTVKLS